VNDKADSILNSYKCTECGRMFMVIGPKEEEKKCPECGKKSYYIKKAT